MHPAQVTFRILVQAAARESWGRQVGRGSVLPGDSPPFPLPWTELDIGPGRGRVLGDPRDRVFELPGERLDVPAFLYPSFVLS